MLGRPLKLTHRRDINSPDRMKKRYTKIPPPILLIHRFKFTPKEIRKVRILRDDLNDCLFSFPVLHFRLPASNVTQERASNYHFHLIYLMADVSKYSRCSILLRLIEFTTPIAILEKRSTSFVV